MKQLQWDLVSEGRVARAKARLVAHRGAKKPPPRGGKSQEAGRGEVPGGLNKATQAESASTSTQTGVRNGGNTCYQNALFRALVKTPALIEVMRQTEDAMLDTRYVDCGMRLLETFILMTEPIAGN